MEPTCRPLHAISSEMLTPSRETQTVNESLSQDTHN